MNESGDKWNISEEEKEKREKLQNSRDNTARKSFHEMLPLWLPFQKPNC